MSTINRFLAADHKRCDQLFAAAEAASAGGDWPGTEAAFGQFRDALLHHFSMEEDILFPTFEERTGMFSGPTRMMRMEHAQMRELLDRMAEAAGRGDGDGFLGEGETLLIVMQQHNIKEEQILYPMADQALAGESEHLVGLMRAAA